MATEGYKYLHFANYKDILNWSVQYVDENNIGFTKKYPTARIGSFLSKSNDVIEVQDDVEYRQITLKINNGGLVPRNDGATLKGASIGTKRQTVIHSGQFIMSKIDARNGAYGIVPDNLDGAIVTNDFPVFNVDQKKIIPLFLVLISTTANFIEFARKCSTGTTNRKRIDINAFLRQSIPLPSIEEQKSIIEKYNKNIEEANELKKEATLIKKEAEEYLLSEIGLQNAADSTPDEENHLLKMYQHSQMERWDCYNMQYHHFSFFNNCRYPVVKMGDAYSFVTRRWNQEGESFRYVEIGSVDSERGILSADTIPTKKAPSRATQIIKEGDLILGTTRPYLKKFAIVASEYDNCVCSSGFQVIAPRNGCNLNYLIDFLKTDLATEQFKFYMTGALYPAITSKELKKIQIPLPPLDIQAKIANHISELEEKVIEIYTKTTELKEKADTAFSNMLFD